MSEEDAGSGNPEAPPQKSTNMELQEYRRISRTLDHEQHMNLSAHLYSAYLIGRDHRLGKNELVEKMRADHRVPHKYWTAWPTKTAPAPPLVDDSVPDPNPATVTREAIDTAVNEAKSRRFPEFEKSVDPSVISLNACENFSQHTIYDRIHNETRTEVKIEPALDPEPSINDVWPASLIELVDKYIEMPLLDKHFVKMKPGTIDYSHLGITGPAGERIERLFGRPLENNGYESDSEEVAMKSEIVEDEDESHSENEE